MIYLMDSVEYMMFARNEPTEALVHTYYASVGTDIKTSGRLHPNVFNWSFLRPSTETFFYLNTDSIINNDGPYMGAYYDEIEPDLDNRVAPILYEVLKNNERLIMLCSEAEKRNLLYPDYLCTRIEEIYKLSVYGYGEDENARPYDLDTALYKLKRRSKKAYIRKLITNSPRSLSKSEVNYILKYFGVKPAEELEERYHQIMEIKRKERDEIFSYTWMAR